MQDHAHEGLLGPTLMLRQTADPRTEHQPSLALRIRRFPIVRRVRESLRIPSAQGSCQGVRPYCPRAISCRRRRWVSRVAGESWRAGFRIVDQSVRETLSASGAMARAHVGAVSESRIANDPIRRHVPSRRSKNHSRRSGPRLIHSRTYASTCGLTGSMRS